MPRFDKSISGGQFVTAARGSSLAPVADWERELDAALCAINAGTTLVGHSS